MNYDIKISDEAFQYLVLHRGSIAHLARNRKAWEDAYRQGIRQSYQGMMRHLPAQCDAVLDVGAGLGGVDILLSNHYRAVCVVLLDGEADPPEVHLHRETFGNRNVAVQFHRDNGNENVVYVSPQAGLQPHPVDLVVSTGAWCFHFPPSMYLDYVKQCLKPGGILITDVRKDRPEWMAELESAFKRKATIVEAKKRIRAVFRNV